MTDFLNLPSKEGQDNQNEILQRIADNMDTTSGAIKDAVDLANTAAAKAEDKITDVENRFQTLTTEQQQDAEVIDARQGKTSLVANIQEIKDNLRSHEAESVHQGKHNTLEATSADNATSVTNAPLKSAGGLAVSKDARIGGSIWSNSYLGGFFKQILTIPSTKVESDWKVIITTTGIPRGAYFEVTAIGQYNLANRRGIHKKIYSNDATAFNTPLEVLKEGISGFELRDMELINNNIILNIKHTTDANVAILIEGAMLREDVTGVTIDMI